jgi:transcription antitermination protein NusB
MASKTRREGREAAVQFLYQIDLNEGTTGRSAEVFWKLHGASGLKSMPPKKARDFAEELVNGVLAHREEIDEKIKKYTTPHYEMERLGAVDRNILRMATFEMIYSLEIAPVIIINEAIEVAKKFGSDKSGSFVNGVLDQLKNDLGRPAREPLVPRKKAEGSKTKPAAPTQN